KARREMIGQQAERAMTLRAIPARDPRPRRIHPRVGAVPGKPAASFGMQGATRQACIPPALLGNVVFAGLPRLESKLHRHRPALAATIAGHLICGDSAEGYRLASRRETPSGDVGKGGPELYSSARSPRGGRG